MSVQRATCGAGRRPGSASALPILVKENLSGTALVWEWREGSSKVNTLYTLSQQVLNTFAAENMAQKRNYK